MPIIEPRYGIEKPTVTDDFDTSTIAANWDKVAAKPGLHLCTSATRPTTWGADHVGMRIFETDSNLEWRWNGSAFVRVGPIGFLGRDQLTSNVSAPTSTFVMVASASIQIPPGGRNILVMGSWPQLNVEGYLALFKGGSRVARVRTDGGGTIMYIDMAPSAGIAEYSLRLAASGGAVTLTNAAAHPSTLVVTEI